MLSALRRGKAKAAEPDGCDPAVFAEQIASYLEHLEEERRIAALSAAERVVEAPADPLPPPTVDRAELLDEFDGGAEPAPSPSLLARDTTRPSPSPSLPADDTPPPSLIAQDTTPPVADRMPALDPEPLPPPTAEGPDEDVSVALEQAVRALFSEHDEPAASEEPADVWRESAAVEASSDAEILTAPGDEPGEPGRETERIDVNVGQPEEHELATLAPPPSTEVQDLPAGPSAAAIRRGRPDLRRIDAGSVGCRRAGPSEGDRAGHSVRRRFSRPSPDEWESLEQLIAALDTMPLAAIEVTTEDEWIGPPPSQPERIVAATEPAVQPVERQELDADADADSAPARSEREWVALIESLRHDVERLRSERAEKPAKKTAAHRTPRSEATRAETARAGAARADDARSEGRSDKKTKPIQDEWGFFDPEQCGFAALLAKLDEVTDSDELHGLCRSTKEETVIWMLIVTMGVVGLAWVKVRRRRKASDMVGAVAMARRSAGGFAATRGATLIEAAIITPLFLLLTFSIVEFGAVFYAYLALENGVSLATRYAVTGNCDGRSGEPRHAVVAGRSPSSWR